MRIRNVLQEFEAHLYPVQSGVRTRGKSEWKRYGDETYRIKIIVRDIPLPDKDKVDLIIDGALFAQLPVQNGVVKLDIENSTGQGIPAIKAGQVLQVKSGEKLLAEGQYQPE